jgi:hypothetical protein
MGIYIEIALTGKLEVKETVPGKKLQHMVEKADSCLDLIFPGSVQSQFKLDLGFGSDSLHPCISFFAHFVP